MLGGGGGGEDLPSDLGGPEGSSRNLAHISEIAQRKRPVLFFSKTAYLISYVDLGKLYA